MDMSYQRRLVVAIDARLGARRMARKELEQDGLSEATLHRIFTLKRSLDLNQLFAIATTLGTTVETLVEEAGRYTLDTDVSDRIDSDDHLTSRQREQLKADAAAVTRKAAQNDSGSQPRQRRQRAK